MHTPQLRYLHGHHTPRCDSIVNKHFIRYYTLQYSTRGTVELFYDRQRYLLKPCSFWTAFPGPLISFHPAAPECAWWEHRYIAVQGKLVERWIRDGLFPLQPQAAPRGTGHAIQFDQITKLFNAADRWSLVRAINLLEGLLLELAQARDTSPTQSVEPWVEFVKNKLTSVHEKQSGNYAKLATELGMGLSTLRRRFRQQTGISLHAYALTCRLNEARALLVNSHEPIKNIAERLGYNDVYFFSRQFREKVGVTPGVFRRSKLA